MKCFPEYTAKLMTIYFYFTINKCYNETYMEGNRKIQQKDIPMVVK